MGSDLQNLHYFAPALKVEQNYQDFESLTQLIINYINFVSLTPFGHLDEL